MKKDKLEDKEEIKKEEEAKASEETKEETTQEEVKEEETSEGEKEEEILDEPVDELTKLNVEISEAKDKYLRLYSEFENFRRRTAKEKLGLMKTAGEKMMVSLIPVLDDFNRAAQTLKENEDSPLAEGFNLISQKFKNALEADGLKQMETEPGTEFDLELHEAITQIPAPEEKLKGKIVDTIEQGYFLGDKVIRFAKVVIGS